MSARILVVEDEEALTTLLRYNLDAEGYEVETVARGDDADTRLKERVPDLILRQLKAALDAYSARNANAAVEVCNADDEIDALYTSLFRELLTYMMEDPRNISFCIHLMFCAKNIERIGDHATNIAETVFYMIEGQQILDKRPKGDMTTFATTVPGN